MSNYELDLDNGIAAIEAVFEGVKWTISDDLIGKVRDLETFEVEQEGGGFVSLKEVEEIIEGIAG